MIDNKFLGTDSNSMAKKSDTQICPRMLETMSQRE